MCVGAHVCYDCHACHIYSTEGLFHLHMHSVTLQASPYSASAVIGGQEMGVWPSVSDLSKGFESVGGGGFSKSL